MNNDYAVLDRLTGIIGPSGYEKDVQKYFSTIMRPFVHDISSDKLGNCYASVNGDESLPRLMFQAHADSVGFIIKYIDDRGFIFTDDLHGGARRRFPGSSFLLFPSM